MHTKESDRMSRELTAIFRQRIAETRYQEVKFTGIFGWVQFTRSDVTRHNNQPSTPPAPHNSTRRQYASLGWCTQTNDA